MVAHPGQSHTDPERTQQEDIDVLLLPTRAWDIWMAGAYRHITDELADAGWPGSPVPGRTFRARSHDKRTYAFRVDAKRVDYTAAVTKKILDHFSRPGDDGICRYRVDRMVLIGYCGTLKGDEFRLGDIGVASQVDCYMEKSKIVGGDKALSGEVYRTTLEYVRIAQNLRYLDPDGYEVFRREAIAARSAYELNDAARERLPSESIAIHTPHLASATLLSTTKGAVQWLLDRDRKLFMIDMESAGMMAAVWAYNQSQSTSPPIKTIVVRAASDFTDETREMIKPARRALEESGVHNVCRFLDWMFGFTSRMLPAIARPSDVDVGIVVPLEEEFSYLVEEIRSLKAPLTPCFDPRERRFSYTFTLENTRCACTFVGDMGLAQMALTTDAFLNAHPGTRLLILVGIAGSIHSDILVCDVALATAVDPYLQGARSDLQQIGPLSPFHADPDLVATVRDLFEHVKEDVPRSCHEMYGELKDVPTRLMRLIREPASITLHCVPFASGDAVAADAGVHVLLKSGARNNAVVEMEASGMHVAAALRPAARGQTLIFRGISDNANAEKENLEKIKPAGILRRIAMTNASSVVLHLLKSGVLGRS